eukprot:366564-Chlamydomonas_euryale.AAC.10
MATTEQVITDGYCGRSGTHSGSCSAGEQVLAFPHRAPLLTPPALIAPPFRRTAGSVAKLLASSCLRTRPLSASLSGTSWMPRPSATSRTRLSSTVRVAFERMLDILSDLFGGQLLARAHRLLLGTCPVDATAAGSRRASWYRQCKRRQPNHA